MSIQLGLDAKVYYKEGGVAGGGSWTELTNCRDLTLGMEKDQIDVSTRGGGYWKRFKGGQRTATVEWEMMWKEEDAGFQAIRDSFMENAVIGLKILDRASGEGLVADVEIMKFSRKEPLTEGIALDISAALADSATDPEWVEAT